MIPVKRLLYKLDLRLNKKASNEHQSIALEDKILALNEAQIKLIKKKLNSNNEYGLGLDSFKKRYQDLQLLVENFEELSVSANNDVYSSYRADLNTTTKKYFLPLDMYVLCNKDLCKSRPVYLSKIIKHGDISTYMSNVHYAPSFEYQETFCTISNNNINVYTDGTFDVNKLYLSYLRYPTKIDYEGYVDFDGAASTIVDCELPEYLEDELLDLTILELAMDTENIPVVEFNNIRNKNNE